MSLTCPWAKSDIVGLSVLPAAGFLASADSRGRLVVWDYVAGQPAKAFRVGHGGSEEAIGGPVGAGTGQGSATTGNGGWMRSEGMEGEVDGEAVQFTCMAARGDVSEVVVGTPDGQLLCFPMGQMG
jgi:hypothetical protein